MGVNKPFKNRIQEQWESWMVQEGIVHRTVLQQEKKILSDGRLLQCRLFLSKLLGMHGDTATTVGFQLLLRGTIVVIVMINKVILYYQFNLYLMVICLSKVVTNCYFGYGSLSFCCKIVIIRIFTIRFSTSFLVGHFIDGIFQY